MAKGTIKRLITDQGFGFIKRAEGEDLFFHRSKLQGVDYDSLREGQEVEFEVRRAFGGRPQALNVRLAQAKAE
jgi:CspA family cold shock protein